MNSFTKTTPSKAGYYWYKPAGKSTKPVILEVKNSGVDTRLIAVPITLAQSWIELNEMLGQWAGPLEPPILSEI